MSKSIMVVSQDDSLASSFQNHLKRSSISGNKENLSKHNSLTLSVENGKEVALRHNHREQQAAIVNGGEIASPSLRNKGQSQLEPQQKEEQSPKFSFQKLCFNIKLKQFGLRILNSTKSRMFKNLTSQQYRQLDDLTAFSHKKYMNQNNSNGSKFSLLNNRNKNLSTEFVFQDQSSSKNSAFCNGLYSHMHTIRKSKFIQKIRQMLKKIAVFDPSSNAKLRWDFLIMALSMVFVFLIPLHLAFNCSLSFFVTQPFTFSCAVIFLIDILVNINTGYFDKGQLRVKHRLVWTHYLKHCFFGDFLGGIFFFAHVISKENSYGSEFTSDELELRDYLLLFFLLRISTFSSVFKRLEEVSLPSRKQKNMISLLKLIFIIILIAHLLSCMWIKIGLVQNHASENSWMKSRNLISEDWYTQYIESYYFNTVTMVTVGYGDIFPVTKKEQCLSIGMMLVSCGVFAYSMNTVGNILSDIQSEQFLVDRNMSIINKYMSKKTISKVTQSRVREYLGYYWREQSEGDSGIEQEIIASLSDVLKQALAREGNKIILNDSKIFSNNFSDSVMTKVIPMIKEQRCTPEQIIFEEGDRDSQFIYFVQKGSVEFFIDAEVHNQKKPKVLKVLHQGRSFGELGFFTGNPRTMSVRSREFTTLLLISRWDFVELIKNHDKDYESFCSLKDSLLLYKDYSVLGMKCFSCFSNHLIHSCNYLHDIPNHRRIILQFCKNVNQSRGTLSRKGIRSKNAKHSRQICDDCSWRIQIDYKEHIDLLYQVDGDEEESSNNSMGENDQVEEDDGDEDEGGQKWEYANKDKSFSGEPENAVGKSKGITVDEPSNVIQNRHFLHPSVSSFDNSPFSRESHLRGSQESQVQQLQAPSPKVHPTNRLLNNINLSTIDEDSQDIAPFYEQPQNILGKNIFEKQKYYPSRFQEAIKEIENNNYHEKREMQQAHEVITINLNNNNSLIDYNSPQHTKEPSRMKVMFTNPTFTHTNSNSDLSCRQKKGKGFQKTSTFFDQAQQEIDYEDDGDDRYSRITSFANTNTDNNLTSQKLKALQKFKKKLALTKKNSKENDCSTNIYNNNNNNNRFLQDNLSRCQTLNVATVQKKQSLNDSFQMQWKKLLLEESNLKEILLKNQLENKPKDDEFEIQKNFRIYFPFNNLSYILELQLIPSFKERVSRLRQIPFLNRSHIHKGVKSSVNGLQSPTLKNNSTMRQIVNKFLKHEQGSEKQIIFPVEAIKTEQKDKGNDSFRIAKNGNDSEVIQPQPIDRRNRLIPKSLTCLDSPLEHMPSKKKDTISQKTSNSDRIAVFLPSVEDKNLISKSLQLSSIHKEVLPKVPMGNVDAEGNSIQLDCSASCSLRDDESFYLPPIQQSSTTKQLIQFQ